MECCEYQLKFVVARPEDLAEIRSIVERIGAARERVVLMPEGTDAGVLRERGVWLVEIAKREGFRFSPRLQIELYGNRRGV
jgi:7-carboxy-7-deazaguanine synthase